MLRDLKGEEGGAKGVVRGDGDAPEPRRGAFGDAAVEKAGSTRGRGIRSVKEGKEGERRHHCRSCSFHTNTLTATVSFTAVPQRTTAIKDSRNETHAGGELTRNRVFTSRQVKSRQVKSSQVRTSQEGTCSQLKRPCLVFTQPTQLTLVFGGFDSLA